MKELRMRKHFLNSITATALTSAVVMLTGCQPNTVLDLQNNSANLLTLECREFFGEAYTLSIEPGTSQRLSLGNLINASTDDRYKVFVLAVNASSGKTFYPMDAKIDFSDSKAAGIKRSIALSYESDRLLYLIAHDGRSRLEPQPAPFPIHGYSDEELKTYVGDKLKAQGLTYSPKHSSQ